MALETIAIIGAATSGRSIALRALRAGYRVVLEDFSTQTLECAAAWLSNKISPALQTNLQFTVGVENAIRDANLIIETSADEIETKIELFTIFDKFAKPGAIFATTSEAHSISEIAEVTAYPERCVAIRLDSARDSARFKTIAGEHTSRSTIDACDELTQRLNDSSSTMPTSLDL